METLFSYSYYTQAITIPSGMVIPRGCFEGCSKVKRVIIESDFDIDTDMTPRFSGLASLQEFIVNDPLAFFTEDGVLFYDIWVGGKYKNFLRGFNINNDSAQTQGGRVLVAFPAGYKDDTYEIPSDVVGIACSAFAGSGLVSLTVPDSVQNVGVNAFWGMTKLRHLYVPNKMVTVNCELSVENDTDCEVLPSQQNGQLSEKVVRLWKDVICSPLFEKFIPDYTSVQSPSQEIDDFYWKLMGNSEGQGTASIKKDNMHLIRVDSAMRDLDIFSLLQQIIIVDTTPVYIFSEGISPKQISYMPVINITDISGMQVYDCVQAIRKLSWSHDTCKVAVDFSWCDECGKTLDEMVKLCDALRILNIPSYFITAELNHIPEWCFDDFTSIQFDNDEKSVIKVTHSIEKESGWTERYFNYDASTNKLEDTGILYDAHAIWDVDGDDVEKNSKTQQETYAKGRKEITIPNGVKIPYGCFKGCNSVERVIIESDFDVDDDEALRFNELVNLKEFVVKNPGPFFARDGVLFYDTRIGGDEKGFLYAFDNTNVVDDKEGGIVLVSFPMNYMKDTYVIPDDVVGIACSAFYGTKLVSLTIPESVQFCGLDAFSGMTMLKRLYVPNQYPMIWCEHYDQNKMDFEILPLHPGEELATVVTMSWNDVMNKQPSFQFGVVYRGKTGRCTNCYSGLIPVVWGELTSEVQKMVDNGEMVAGEQLYSDKDSIYCKKYADIAFIERELLYPTHVCQNCGQSYIYPFVNDSERSDRCNRNNMVEKNKEQIVEDFAKAWETLDAELIIANLDETFVYDSQWVFESLDYRGYIDYIRAKFEAIKNSGTKLSVMIVPDKHSGGTVLSLQQDNNAPAFYRIEVKNGKVIKGDLCMF